MVRVAAQHAKLMRSLLACLVIVCAAAAHADGLQVTATLVETDPVSPAVLHGNDNV